MEGYDGGYGVEHTTAIQYAQSLWLSWCSLGVGHSNSNSKQCVIEEMVPEENRGVERGRVPRCGGELVLRCKAMYNVDY